MSVRDQMAGADIMEVITKALSTNDVEVLVCVLAEVPATSPSPVVLAIPGLDLYWQRFAGKLEREFEESAVASGTSVASPQISPGVKEIGQPVEPSLQLGVGERGKAHCACHHSTPWASTR